MKIATWNVNSVRARLERLLAFLERHAPDAVCLQETKGTEESFPRDAVREAGYHALVSGQKTYNGVAILSKVGIEDVFTGFPEDEPGAEARVLGAIVGGLVGAIVCTPLLPIPVEGTLIGALLGTFIGAWIGEAGAIRADDPAATFKAASGAALGRLAGTLGKLLVAVVVWVLLVVAAFVP